MAKRQNSNNELYYVPFNMKYFFRLRAQFARACAREQNLIVSTAKQRAAQLTTAPQPWINARRTIETRCNPKNLSPHVGDPRPRAHVCIYTHRRNFSRQSPAKGENDRRRLFQRGMGHKSPSK